MKYMWCFVSYWILLQTGKTDSYHMKCPSLSQWYIRAKAVCNKINGYHCLYDENKDHFSEFCRNKSSPDNAGYKAVLVGNIDGKKCDDDRYQPFKYWTNGSEHCAYAKSECTEEGQITFTEGSTISDRECRCDYTRGYAFVTMPKNQCFCVPSTEDCSCYVKSCPNGSVLTPDYKCIPIIDWKANFQCKFITDLSGRTTVTSPAVKVLNVDNHDVLKLGVQPVVVIIIILVVSVIFLTGFSICLLPPFCYYGPFESRGNFTILENIKELEKHRTDDMRDSLKSFVKTRAANDILNTMKTRQCIIITGPPGSGKSSVAYWVAFKMEDIDDYDFTVLTHLEDLLMCAGTSKTRVFVVDDVFGNNALHEYDLKSLNTLGKKINDILSKNKDIKLIMTSRTHIYKSIDAEKFKLSYLHTSLIEDSLKLTTEERRKIAEVYLSETVIKKLSDDIISKYHCFPLLCAMFKPEECIDPVQHFKCPYKFYKESFEHLDKQFDVNFYTLSLLVIKNNYIKKEFFVDENDEHDKLLKDLAKEIGFNHVPFSHIIQSSLLSMEDTYTRETISGFSFFTDEMFQIATNVIGEYIIQNILEYGKLDFLRNRCRLQSLSDMHDEFTITVPDDLEHAYFERFLDEIKNGNMLSVLTDQQNKFPEFRKSFSVFLKKHLQTSVIAKCKDVATVLHAVSLHGYGEYISILVKPYRKLINVKDINGKTALHIACLTGHVSTVNELLNHNANVNVYDNDDNAPLDLACTGGYSDVVKILLPKKPHVKQKGKKEQPALHIVCNNGNVDITKLLLDYKFNTRASDKNGKTPLHLASAKGHETIVKMLLEHNVLINMRDNKGRTPLVVACQGENKQVVELLLDKNADIEIKDDDGISPFMHTCHSGNTELIQLLLSYNAHVMTTNNKGNTPLHVACFKGDRSLAELLIKNGVDVNKENHAMRTPLHLACKNGNEDIVQNLIYRGANVNKLDVMHITPLIICCKIHHCKLATLLLKNKADVNIKDLEDATPLLSIACNNNDRDTVKSLLIFKANVNDTDKNGRSPLYCACKNENVDIVNDLLAFNTDVNQSDNEGLAPLHLVSQSGCIDIIKLLLECNACVNQTAQNGQTPLFKAAQEGHVDCVKCLVSNGALIDTYDKYGNSPLGIALQCGYIDIVAYLQNFSIPFETVEPSEMNNV